jgi:hypothetical protein
MTEITELAQEIAARHTPPRFVYVAILPPLVQIMVHFWCTRVQKRLVFATTRLPSWIGKIAHKALLGLGLLQAG